MLRRIYRLCVRPLFAKRTRPRPLFQCRGVELWFWRPPSEMRNFGDELSPIIVNYLLNKQGLYLDEVTPTRRRDCSPRRLFAVGSILHEVRPGDVVWGSGLNPNSQVLTNPPFTDDVRLVRGPVTAKFLARTHGCSCEKYGDPALLLPKIYPRNDSQQSSGDWIFIPNFRDLPFFDTDRMVHPTLPWRTVVDRICGSQLVLSSSLHGIIVAEAYGIPARLILSRTEALLKYEDYYSGTNRAFRPACTIHEGLALGGEPSPSFDLSVIEGTFPYDIFLDASE